MQVVWTSLMAAFTIPLNSTSDPHVVDLCLEGLRLCIHIACIFSMDLERGAFVPALAKFTNLAAPHEIKHKNIQAIRCLLGVCLCVHTETSIPRLNGRCASDVSHCIVGFRRHLFFSSALI